MNPSPARAAPSARCAVPPHPQSYAEHEAIVRAILAGDTDAAGVALRGHVVVQGERFGDLLASLAELKTEAEA